MARQAHLVSLLGLIIPSQLLEVSP